MVDTLKQLKLRPVLGGILSLTPLYEFARGRKAGGATKNAAYCYSVWLKHVQRAFAAGMTERPAIVAEVGPGSTLGVGITALVGGATKLYGLDIRDYGVNDTNLETLPEIIRLLENKTSPGEDLSFPDEIYPDAALAAAMAPERLDAIRDALDHIGRRTTGTDPEVSYFAPWDGKNIAKPNSVDFIYSQSVMEHVDDIQPSYDAMYRWLKPGGFMSHWIDYKCHSLTKDWNGHWSLPSRTWKLLRGGKKFLINRTPHSHQVEAIRASGFDVRSEETTPRNDGLRREELCEDFAAISDADLATSGAHVIARKPPG